MHTFNRNDRVLVMFDADEYPAFAKDFNGQLATVENVEYVGTDDPDILTVRIDFVDGTYTLSETEAVKPLDIGTVVRVANKTRDIGVIVEVDETYGDAEKGHFYTFVTTLGVRDYAWHSQMVPCPNVAVSITGELKDLARQLRAHHGVDCGPSEFLAYDYGNDEWWAWATRTIAFGHGLKVITDDIRNRLLVDAFNIWNA